MDPLAARLEDLGDRVLGEPVDGEVGVELAQLVGDRDVALSMAETDRRGDVEGAASARAGTLPGRGGRSASTDELAQEQIDLDRVARVWDVPRAFECYELAAGRLRQRRTLFEWADLVLRRRGSRASGSVRARRFR